jgi:hypothetical protein
MPSPTAVMPQLADEYPVGPDVYPANVDPLTGLQAEYGDLLDRRPVMIKVSNFPISARPQFGLSYTDLVFEYYIGEGGTRYAAVFYGRDSEQVGPIRSSRLTDVQLASMYGAVLGFKGFGDMVQNALRRAIGNRYLADAGDCCDEIFPRNPSDINAIFVDTAVFSDYIERIGIDNQRPPLEGMAFDTRPPEGGEAGSRAWIRYYYRNQVAWQYDPATHKYLREQDELNGVLESMPDALTQEQIAVDNVVILVAFHTFETSTRISIDLWNADQFQAYVFRDGMVYDVTFSAIAPDRPLRFYDSNGDPFYLKPGNTWFQIVGIRTVISSLENGEWLFDFDAP